MGVELRLDVFSLVRDGGKSARELQVCDSVCDAAQGQRLVHIQGLAVFQGGDSEALRILETDGRGDFRQAVDGHDVDGVRDGLADRGVAGVGVVAVPVVDGDSVPVGVGRVVVNAGKSHIVIIQSRSVGGNDFEGGTRLAGGGGGPVQGKARFFGSAAAHDGFHIAGGLIHDDEGGLGLWSQRNPFAQDRFAVGCLALFKGSEGRAGGIFIVEHQIKGRIKVLAIPGAEIVVSIMDRFAFRGLDAEGIVHAHLGSRGEIGKVGKFLVTDLLDCHILNGIDFQALGEQDLIGLLFCVALLFHEILDDLVDHGVHIVSVDRSLLSLGIRLLNSGVNVVRHRLIVGFLGNVALFQHVVQNGLTPHCIFLRMGDGVIAGGVLGDTGQHRALGEIQLGNAFSEVTAGGGLNAVGAGTEVDGVEVILQNLLLADLFLQLEGQVLFLEFPAEAVDQGGFVHPAREDAVFQKLLGDGAGSLVEAAGSKTVNAGAENAADVNALVLVETLVLDGYDGMLEILRDLVDRDNGPVGGAEGELLHDGTIAVIDVGGGLRGGHGKVGNIRRRGDEAF